MRSVLRIWIAIILSVFPLRAAEQRGQVKYGGLGVPGATVTATRGEKAFTVITDPAGYYDFADLADGAWTFQVEMLCFNPIKQDATFTAGLPGPDWELKLLPMAEIQSAAGSIKPAAPPPAPLISLTPSSKNNNKKKTATATPQTAFQRTDVNASAAPPSAPPPPASENAADLSLRATDGLLINGSANNGASSPFSQSNAFGNNRRGVRSLYTGNLSFSIDNSALDARNYSITGQDLPKSAQQRFTVAGSFAGPIRIPHLIRNGPFFTLNYQWTRNRSATTNPATVPTLAERAGIFTQPLNAFGQQAAVDPVALALLKYYPLPNFASSGGYNYESSLVSHTNQNALQLRMNKAIGRKDTFDGLFAFQGAGTQNKNLFDFLDDNSTFGLNSQVGWRHRMTSRTILHLQEQFSRQVVTTTPYFANRINVSGEAGITGNNQEPVNWGPPTLVFSSGIASLNDGNPVSNHNQTNAVAFDGLWYRTPHSFTYGVDYKRLQFNSVSQANPRGTFVFTGLATGDDFADFLLGAPDTTTIAFGNADKYFRTQSYDAWVNDDWRISPSFTLQTGLRWEYNSPATELYGRLVNLAIGPNFSTATPVVAGNPGNSLINPDLHEFQPRMGFSWRPFPASSMVVRGGYGIYYNTSVYQTIASQMAQQAPLSKAFSVPNTATDSLTLANAFNAIPTTSTADTFAIDPNFRVGYAQNWQLSAQRDLPQGLVMIVNYLGIKGTRAVQEFLPNTYPVGAVKPAGFAYMTSNGNSHRQSGEFQLRRRLHAGLTASADYTFSKSIDDAALGGKGQGTAVIAQNWLDLSGERGLSTFDQRHLLVASGQYTSGMGAAGGTLLEGWKGTLVKEWTLQTQATFGSGLPLTPILPVSVPGTGFTNIIRPEYTGAPLYSTGSPSLFLNPASYVAPPDGQWGNAGRDSITGPPQFTLNASLSRTFRLNDRYNLDLIMASTNVLNHVTYQGYITTVGPQFGLPTVANPMRSILTTLRVRF